MYKPLSEIATLIKGYSVRSTPLEDPNTQYLVLKSISTSIVDPANNYSYTFTGKDISKYIFKIKIYSQSTVFFDLNIN